MTRPSPMGEQADQVLRLSAFRAAHPQVAIATLGYGAAWQARIPEDRGETVLTRYLLRELLDKLGEVLGEP